MAKQICLPVAPLLVSSLRSTSENAETIAETLELSDAPPQNRSSSFWAPWPSDLGGALQTKGLEPTPQTASICTMRKTCRNP